MTAAPMEEKDAWRLDSEPPRPARSPRDGVADALAIAEDWERARAAATELRRALEFAHEWMGLEGHDCDSKCVVRAALEKNGGRSDV
jgi:hypothetical protein